MTLSQLANFVRIVELQSLSKAAAVIRIAQPALSRQIRTLEAELGTSLLVRHAWGVTPTAAGDLLATHARRLLQEAQNTRDAVRGTLAEPSGRVALGVPTSVATALIPALVIEIRNRFPKLRPHFVDGFSAVLHKRSMAGELDLAILYEDRMMGPLTTKPLLRESLVLVGPPEFDERSGEDVLRKADLSLILPARPNRLRLIIEEALPRRYQREECVVEVDSLPAIIEIVSSGGGTTLLPFSTVALAEREGRVRVWNLDIAKLSRTLLLARPLDRQPSATVEAVESSVRSLVCNLAKELRWIPLSG